MWRHLQLIAQKEEKLGGMSMSNHSPIGPSSAKRILACPGSVALCAKAPPSEPSKYAEEGTQAHEVAEAYTLGKALSSWATEEMIDGAKMYAGLIEDLLLNASIINIPLKLETKVCASSIREDAFGTCDAFFIADGILYIIDYKYGKGVAVDAFMNEQLMMYALGVIDTYNVGAIIETHLIIVQPRNGGITKWETNIGVLKNFRDRMKAALKSSELKINDACRWCPALALCPKQLEEIQEKFNVNVQEPIEVFPSVENISPTQFKIYLENAEMLESWVKAIKSQAFSAIGRGMVIEGYELTEGLGNRKWKDEQFAKRQLTALYPAGTIYEYKLKSPAQMEKIIPKEEVALLTVRESTGKRLTKTEIKAPDLFNAFNVIGD
jgi:hypothetical protein